MPSSTPQRAEQRERSAVSLMMMPPWRSLSGTGRDLVCGPLLSPTTTCKRKGYSYGDQDAFRRMRAAQEPGQETVCFSGFGLRETKRQCLVYTVRVHRSLMAPCSDLWQRAFFPAGGRWIVWQAWCFTIRKKRKGQCTTTPSCISWPSAGTLHSFVFSRDFLHCDH